MTQRNECLTDDNNIEILVSYEYETSASQIEYGHGKHEVGKLVETTLKTLEVVIAGVGIDILNQLNERQKASIISQLTYE